MHSAVSETHKAEVKAWVEYLSVKRYLEANPDASEEKIQRRYNISRPRIHRIREVIAQKIAVAQPDADVASQEARASARGANSSRPACSKLNAWATSSPVSGWYTHPNRWGHGGNCCKSAPSN